MIPDPRAARAVAFGLWLAELANDRAAIGDLLQRQAYVKWSLGDYRSALALAERATGLYFALGNQPRLGKALVDQGKFYYYLGRHRCAIRSLGMALDRLPDSERQNRLSALQIQGFCYLALGNLGTALECVQNARENAAMWSGPRTLAKILWLLAGIYQKMEQLDEAEDELHQVVALLQDQHPGDTCLAGLDLVRVQFLQGQVMEAFQTSRTLRKFVMPFSENPVMAAALTELLRISSAAELTLALVDKVRKTIKRERERLEGRSLRPDESGQPPAVGIQRGA